MSIATFEKLLAKIEPHISRHDTMLRESISARVRLLLTLRFLATGERYINLHYSFRISVPSISLIIPETVAAVYKVLKDEYLVTPTTSSEWKKISDEFYKLWNFPNCLGALDGKHIAFRATKKDGSFYYNYKGFHSIVLMALVDAQYNFTYVDVGCNGRVSDGGVFSNSTLYTAIEQNALNFPNDEKLPQSNVEVPYVIVTDEAFRLTKRMMKPWGQRSSISEKIFNYRLSRARRVVENAFGILANRFQILQRDINLSVDKVQDITLTCCVLHNYIKKNDGKSYLQGIDHENTESVNITNGSWREEVFSTSLQACTVNRSPNDAMKIRSIFTKYFNKEGFVPWQWEAVKKFNF
ncbi:putative nuclease HARBI1 [Zophobas morio]|uniref:putative nuclease HARBI1 n=1 Tax=Zophobas morio TaxID=2755281 RepID=UPI0030832497